MTTSTTLAHDPATSSLPEDADVTPSAERSLKVLVVDDGRTNRMILKSMLAKQGYTVLAAENGQLAVEAYESHRPDIVFMDVLMPVMDGYEAARAIKRLSGDRFVPVVFLAAKQDDASLANCIEYGGDDILTKPYSQAILRAKIDALLRVRGLYSDLRSQRDELEYHQQRLAKEQEVAKLVFENVVRSGHLDTAGVKYLVSPMSIFSGNLLLAAHKPCGGLHVLVGDFTGHGLSAAIGAMPVSDLFYELTEKGLSVSDLVVAIHCELKKILPAGLCFAACLMEVDAESRSACVWSGGSPDVLVHDGRGHIRRRVVAAHPPLGILDDDKLDPRPEIVPLEPGDRIYAYSDGVIEARDPEGRVFGQERLEAVFARNKDPERLLQEIRDELDAFRHSTTQGDDITLIEVRGDVARGAPDARRSPQRPATAAGDR